MALNCPVFKNIRGKYRYIVKVLVYYPDWWKVFFSRIIQKPLLKVKLKNGLQIEGGNKSLIVDLVDEIFIDHVYNPELLQIKPGNIVVDVGANIGVFSLFASTMGANKIYSIEPLKYNIKQIKNNFKLNRLPIPIIINKAISDKVGISKLYLGDLDSHGLLFDHNNTREFKKFIQVETTTLSTIIKKYKIEKIDFLKIDCEGSEGDIILSTPKEMWKIIYKIAIEYHDGVSNLNHREIIRHLKKQGYKVKLSEGDNYFGYIYAYK